MPIHTEYFYHVILINSEDYFKQNGHTYTVAPEPSIGTWDSM